jgi:hypothetical protein
LQEKRKMIFTKRLLPLVCAAALTICAFAQIHTPSGPGLATSSSIGGPSAATTCGDNRGVFDGVPNLVWDPTVHLVDPLGRFSTGLSAYAPMWVYFDGMTLRDVFTVSGTDINCPGFDLIIQSVEFAKYTPYVKCTAFVSGPGSGLNTNFDTGLKKATNDDLDKPILSVALGIKDPPYLSRRALLFSPPHTSYSALVQYVRRDRATGRIGPPMTALYGVMVNVPTRADIEANIDYFSTVAAGVTQKPKIDFSVALTLEAVLASVADDLAALIQFETIIAECSIDFAVLRDATDPVTGKYDTRFKFNYLVDSDEEPIGCLLTEMANAALWH